MFHHPKNTYSPIDKRNDTTHMVLEGELAINLHANDIEVGTSASENPRQDQVILGRAHSPGSRFTFLNKVLLMRVGGETSQLDLPSQTPLSIAGSGRL